MLIIRLEQMRALAMGSELEFRQSLPKRLLAIMPDLAHRVPRQFLEAFAERALKQAGAYGLESPRDVFTYVSLAALFGEGRLEEDPWISSLLTNSELSGNFKSDTLLSMAARILK